MMSSLHLRHCLCPFKAITAILLNQIGKNKRIGSLLAIFRKNTNQEQIYRIRLVPLQNLQHLQPTRREKLAIAYLAQRIGKRRCRISSGLGTSKLYRACTNLGYLLIDWKHCPPYHVVSANETST